MMILAKVTPQAKKEKIEKRNSEFYIWVRERPKDDQANQRVIELLSRYFNIPKSLITIVRGRRTRKKLIAITSLPE